MFSKFKKLYLHKIIKRKYIITILIFLIWVIFIDSNSFIRCTRVSANIGKQEREKEYYKKEIKAIEEKLNELSSNRDSLEQFAREQYNFHKEDEDIFLVW